MFKRHFKAEIERKAESYRDVGIEAALVSAERDKTRTFKGWGFASLSMLYQIKTGDSGNLSGIIFTAGVAAGAVTLPFAYLSHHAFKEAFREIDTTGYANVGTHRKRAWRDLTYASLVETAAILTTPLVVHLVMTATAVGLAATSVFNWLDASRMKMQRRIRRIPN